MKLFVIMALMTVAAGAEDKAFSWAWNDQLKPTIYESWDSDGKLILGTTIGLTILANAYDKRITL